MTSTNDQWMTVRQVADYLKLSADLIYKLAQQGEIPASKVRSRWRFKRAKIDEWMELQTCPIAREKREL